MGHMESKTGYVYLIQAGDLYRFKIGCATNLEKRLSSLKTASPVPLCLLGAKKVADMYAEEKNWHKLFSATRKKGEWFDLDPKQFLNIVRAFKIKYGIRPSDRTLDDLKIGGIYYISLDGNKAIEVELIELEFFNDPKKYDHAVVKETSGRQSWRVFPDEVRSTPIGALCNFMFVFNSRLIPERKIKR